MRYWKNNQIPQAPYYACIFASEKNTDLTGYAEMDKLALDLAMQQDGFLGYEQAGNNENGIFISYWNSLEDIEKWKINTSHMQAKQEGNRRWYKRYLTQICRVESAKEFKK